MKYPWIIFWLIFISPQSRFGLVLSFERKPGFEKKDFLRGSTKPLLFSKQIYENLETVGDEVKEIQEANLNNLPVKPPLPNRGGIEGKIGRKNNELASRKYWDLSAEKLGAGIGIERTDKEYIEYKEYGERKKNDIREIGRLDKEVGKLIADEISKTPTSVPTEVESRVKNENFEMKVGNERTFNLPDLKKEYLIDKKKEIGKEVPAIKRRDSVQRVDSSLENKLGKTNLQTQANSEYLETGKEFHKKKNIFKQRINPPRDVTKIDQQISKLKDLEDKTQRTTTNNEQKLFMDGNQELEIYDQRGQTSQMSNSKGVKKAVDNFMKFLWGDKYSNRNNRLSAGNGTTSDKNNNNYKSDSKDQTENIPGEDDVLVSEATSSDFAAVPEISFFSSKVVGHVGESGSGVEEFRVISSGYEGEAVSDENEVPESTTYSGQGSGFGSGDELRTKVTTARKKEKGISGRKLDIEKATKTSSGREIKNKKGSSRDSKKKYKAIKLSKEKQEEKEKEKTVKPKKIAKSKNPPETENLVNDEPPDFPELNDESTGNSELLFLKDRAKLTGAFCLDGSPPSVFIRHGSGDGVRKWIVYLQGGAWCYSVPLCYGRSTTILGTSTLVTLRSLARIQQGILSPRPDVNPSFYFWNAAIIPYCDGASFSGNKTNPVKYKDRFLYFRGIRILHAAIDELLDRGLIFADEVIFAGSSAGGLAAMLHADDVRSQLPDVVYFRGLMDSGFFVDAKSVYGDYVFRNQMQQVAEIHHISDGVDRECSQSNPGKEVWRCLFPQYAFKFLDTPTFVFNPLFDSWQLSNIYGIDCVTALVTCSTSEKKSVINYRKLQFDALANMSESSTLSHALFADSCIEHVQCFFDNKWSGVTIGATRLQQYFFDWYYGLLTEKPSILIDSKLPINPTCHSFFKLFLSDPNVLKT